jgi:hypothetical protein
VLVPLLFPVPACDFDALELRDRPPAIVASYAAPVPPTSTKDFLGTPWGQTVTTTNFALVWSDGEATLDQANAIGADLERAWDALVLEQGWRQPHSSEQYLIWVQLDPFLGVDGNTTVLTAEAFPDGYPVLSIDPSQPDPGRLAAAAAHQLMHALQMRVADPSDADGADGWYWEATAVWAEQAVDATDTSHARWASSYLEFPWLPHDSLLEDHDHGMFLLNLWLEGQRPGIVAEIWDLSSTGSWESRMVDILGRDIGDVWGGFTGAVAADLLDPADLYPAVVPGEVVLMGSSGYVDYLGTNYHLYDGDIPRTVGIVPLIDGQLTVASSGLQVGTSVVVGPGEVVAVTGLSPTGANYQLMLSDAPPVIGDSLGPDLDLGAEESVRTVTGGCQQARGPVGLWAWLMVLVVGRRRR